MFISRKTFFWADIDEHTHSNAALKRDCSLGHIPYNPTFFLFWHKWTYNPTFICDRFANRFHVCAKHLKYRIAREIEHFIVGFPMGVGVHSERQKFWGVQRCHWRVQDKQVQAQRTEAHHKIRSTSWWRRTYKDPLPFNWVEHGAYVWTTSDHQCPQSPFWDHAPKCGLWDKCFNEFCL